MDRCLKGKMNKQVDVTFTVPGFYVINASHANMGMIGLIVGRQYA